MSGKESEISRQCDLPLEIAPSNNTSGGIEQQKQSNNDENLLNSLGYKQACEYLFPSQPLRK